MAFTTGYRHQFTKLCAFYMLLLGPGAIRTIPKNKSFHNPGKPPLAWFAISCEGYDARTGKWINKKPSPYAFAITPEVYSEVKNWYATDSGTNNPDHLPVLAPRYGFTYIYTPYKDPKHPAVVGMSMQGEQGYKGYWYADDLSKATDSTDANGNTVAISHPEDNASLPLKYGGYDARTDKWINTPAPGNDAYPITQGTYQRIKNWYATHYGMDNPLNLKVEVPREGFTYINVPYKDPKHPGVIGMSFQGDFAYRGYWYADRLSSLNDTIGNPGNVPDTTHATKHN